MDADTVPGAVSEEWHYSHEGVRCDAPVSRARLIEMLQARELDEESSVWRTGWADWRTVGSSEFREYLRAPTAPPPLTGAAVSNTIIWWLAFAPLIGLFIEEFISGITGLATEALWLVTVVLNVVLCIMGEKKLKAAGHDTTRLGATWLIPVYILKRRKMLRHNWAYFIVWCVTFAWMLCA